MTRAAKVKEIVKIIRQEFPELRLIAALTIATRILDAIEEPPTLTEAIK